MNTTNRNLNVRQSYELQSTEQLAHTSVPKTKAEINEFIKGQLIKGEVLDLRDCDIRLLLSDGTILKGSIDSSISLIIGEQASFVVEQNTDKLYLRLQPKDSLKTLDATVDKALEEAMLPKNEKNITIVNTLLKYGMSIDKNSIISMLRQSSMFRDISIETLAILNKYQIPVTETNATQLEIYRNYEFRLLNQSEQLKEMLGIELTQSDSKSELMTQLIKLLNVNIDTIKSDVSQIALIPNEARDSHNNSNENLNTVIKNPSLFDDNSNNEVQANKNTQSFENTLLTQPKEIQDVNTPANELEYLSNSLSNPAKHTLASEALVPEEKLVFDQWLSDKFTLSLDRLKQPNSISSFYEELETVLEKMQSFFEDHLKANLSESKSNVLSQLTQMKENIDFMKTMNQLFGYVQLPMKLKEHNTHSELFVYTNKKQLRTENGEVSVLLHLDMTYLGPIDVHLSLTGHQVKAKISLEDENSLKLVKEHLPDLETALEKKGYSITTQFEQLEHETKVIRDYFESSPSELLMKRYTFDKRA